VQLTVLQLVKFPTVLWNWKMYYQVTPARHFSLTWTRSMQSTFLHPTYFRPFEYYLSKHSCGFQVATFFQVSRPSSCMHFPSHACHTFCLSKSSWFCHWHVTCWELQSTKFLMTQIIQFPPSFFLLNQSKYLSATFLNTLSLRSSLTVTNHIYIYIYIYIYGLN
jgi:hypothetical protein